MDNPYLIIKYNIHTGAFSIEGSIKREAYQEILTNWILAQMGRGRDDSEVTELDEYTIKISLDLSDDTFTTQSDTGNIALTTGIVREVSSRLPELPL